MKRLYVLLIVLLLVGVVRWVVPRPISARNPVERGASYNGFDLQTCLIPKDEILSGGPPRDGIPALTDPAMVLASEVEYLADEDRVVGVVREGEARAYPLRILVWHEIANDVVGETPVVVTYCPLCQSVLVFDRRVGDVERTFGVSGMLYNSNVLMFDRETESLWSQAQMRAVSGSAAAQTNRLMLLPSELTSWGDWKTRYPDTRVLSDDTGHDRPYQRQAYAQYFATDELMFPVEMKADRPDGRNNKDLMAVVFAGGAAKAYAVEDVSGVVTDRIDGVDVRLYPVPDANSLRIEGEVSGVAYMFWFTLSAMQPDIPEHESHSLPAAEYK